MTNTEKRLEQKAQELTDYCFARGMTVSKLTFNHFIETIQQAVAEERARVVREAEEMRIRFNKKNILIYQIEIENYNMGIDDVISLVLDKPLKVDKDI